LSEARGIIAVKGKGELHTWFLTGRNSAAEQTTNCKS